MANTMIVATHSYRGGTGKSNVTANIATEVAKAGYRVGVVDTDLPSPGVHILFGQDEPTSTVNGTLYRQYEVPEAVIDVTPEPLQATTGAVFLLAGSPKPADIAKIVNEGYSLERLIDIYKEFCESSSLDYLFIDTHPGLNETTLLSITVSDLLLMLLRPDRQDYQGTAVTVDVSRKLGVPNLKFVVNKAISSLDWIQLGETIERTYGDKCLAILPQSEEIMRYGGSGLFCMQQPDHALSIAFREIANTIISYRKVS